MWTRRAGQRRASRTPAHSSPRGSVGLTHGSITWACTAGSAGQTSAEILHWVLRGHLCCQLWVNRMKHLCLGNGRKPALCYCKCGRSEVQVCLSVQSTPVCAPSLATSPLTPSSLCLQTIFPCAEEVVVGSRPFSAHDRGSRPCPTAPPAAGRARPVAPRCPQGTLVLEALELGRNHRASWGTPVRSPQLCSLPQGVLLTH